MKVVREKALTDEFVIEYLELTPQEAVNAHLLVRWLQCNRAWRKDRDNRNAEKLLGESIRALEESFRDYHRRMLLMNRLLSLE